MVLLLEQGITLFNVRTGVSDITGVLVSP